MQRPKNVKKLPEGHLRHVREERKPRAEISQEDGQNWAVSYSDILMVLMSFFVIFFSMEDKDERVQLNRIAEEIRSSTGLKGLQKDNRASKTKEPGSALVDNAYSDKSVIPNSISSGSLENLSLEFDKSEVANTLGKNMDYIMIDLPNQVYMPREFAVNKGVEAYLSRIIAVIKKDTTPYFITFIGHTDDTGIANPERLLESNTDLSALRASRALNYAIQSGIDEASLATQGLRSSVRNTRSLSIKIEKAPNLAH